MYGIMPLQQYGGSYPYKSSNKQGHTAVNDYCMAVGVMLAGSQSKRMESERQRYDCPKNNNDWPNAQYGHQSPHVLVWLK